MSRSRLSYPDKPSLLKAPGTSVHGLVEQGEDSATGLEMLLDALDASAASPVLQQRAEAIVPSGALKNSSTTSPAALADDFIRRFGSPSAAPADGGFVCEFSPARAEARGLKRLLQPDGLPQKPMGYRSAAMREAAVRGLLPAVAGKDCR